MNMLFYNHGLCLLFRITINSFIVYFTLILLIVNITFSIRYSKHHNVSSVSPVVVEPTENQTGTIIFLHGHGENGGDWAPEMKRIRQPYMKVILPSANSWPVTFHKGHEYPSWFDLVGEIVPKIMDNPKGMREATSYVQYLIRKEIRKGIQSQRIILAGYSQGGALALQAALSFPQKLGGIVLFSPLKPMKRTIGKDLNTANLNIPILHCQLDRSPYLKRTTGNRTVRMLQKVSHFVYFREYEGCQSVIEQELEDMKIFCEEHVKKI